MNSTLSDLRIALVGNPNCGKTALFNALTGGRQKVANYPGVTVEKREGLLTIPGGGRIPILDLPGTYSLDSRTPDERITREVVLGSVKGEDKPSLVVAVVDATSLERNLGLVLELKALKLPMVVAVNMMDLARQRGMDLDVSVLSRELGLPCIPVVAIRREGFDQLIPAIESALDVAVAKPGSADAGSVLVWSKPLPAEVRSRFKEVDRIVRAAVRVRARPTLWTDRIDRFVLHPVWGSLLLASILGLMFQAVFSWATLPQDLIKNGIQLLSKLVGKAMAPGPLQNLLIDGVIAGVGSVLVFLPQILLLFLFILLLEDSGYMARAAFLMDRIMGKAGLHGRAFIPLLSSHACVIPGIMATRTIENPRDRLTTILVAPLTTCSARLPVYTLLIGAFIPAQKAVGPFNLQGIVMFGLYAAGISTALIVAAFFRKTFLRGIKPPLLMEMPTYKWPSARGVMLGLIERARLFLKRVGTVILSLSILIWFLCSYPKPPAGDAQSAIHYSFAGRIGHAIEPVIRPIGFNWRIGIALIPGFAAREVMISALATVYSVEADEANVDQALGPILKKDWSLATALSLMIWYVLALQCVSTVAVTRRETNSWRWPLFMLSYMTLLAYTGSWVTFRLATLAGWG